MNHLLWIIGDNHVVALDAIKSICGNETHDGGIITYKDGTQDEIELKELENLIGGVLKTQCVGNPGNRNYNPHITRRFNER